MPIYEYTCACGKTFEKIVRNPESLPVAICPECGQRADRTISSPSPFQWGRNARG